MEGSIRILKRFIGATMIISIFLLLFNFILLGIWVFRGMNEGHSPSVVVQTVAKGLEPSLDTYTLNNTSLQLLQENNAWAMLIDNSGNVVWDYKRPTDMNDTYSLIEVAKFSRGYLMNYPVFVWEHANGLVVVGYPQNSLVKYQHILPLRIVSSMPLKITFLLLINIVLALLLSQFVGYQLIKSIRPLIQGIQALSEGRTTFIEPKGVLRNLSESVNQASSLLQQKNDSLRARDEARSNWIAGISHDIRTPLSMVLGYACDLEENKDIPLPFQQQAGMIRQQAEKLRSLVSDLNLVSMLEYEMQPLNKKTIRLSSLVRQIASEFLNNGLDNPFSFEVSSLDENTQVSADERLLNRAITNLILNSIKHNKEGCLIQLETYFDEKNNTCHIIVSDNGCGISREEQVNLMELPFSSKRKHTTQNGHGLGLPMVARIAKAHHGEFILISDVGKGVHAEMILPSIKGSRI